MSGVVYDDAEPPEAYTLDLTPDDSGVDLSTVSAAELRVRRQDGTKTVWTASLTNQTTTTLTLTHEFAVGELKSGTYVIKAALTIPSGVVKTPPRNLTIKGAYEVR